MILGLYGLGAMTVEEYAASVVAALQALGFTTRTQSNVEPDRLNTPNVRIWMRMGASPELSTTLTQGGQPWVVYSASNIATIQAGRYQDMYPSASVQEEKYQGALLSMSEEGRVRDIATRASVVPASFSFSNDTTGNRSLLRVGDRWTLTVTGAPNSDVVIVGGPGGSMARNTMGRTNASGVWETSGSPGVAEIGNWSQQISVGGVSAGTLVFQVAAATAVTPPAEKKSVSEILADQAGAAGVPDTWLDWATANPWLLAGGAAAVLFFVMGRGK
jgi:hypothetical protein